MTNPDLAEALERVNVLVRLKNYYDEHQSSDTRYIVEMHDALLTAKAPLGLNEVSIVVSRCVEHLSHGTISEIDQIVTHHIFQHLKKISNDTREHIEMVVSKHHTFLAPFESIALQLDVWTFLTGGEVDPFFAKLMTPFTHICNVKFENYEQVVDALKADEYQRKYQTTPNHQYGLKNLTAEKFDAQKQSVISTLFRASQEDQGASEYLREHFKFDGKFMIKDNLLCVSIQKGNHAS